MTNAAVVTPKITCRIQYRKDANSPLVDLGDVPITEEGEAMKRAQGIEIEPIILKEV